MQEEMRNCELFDNVLASRVLQLGMSVRGDPKSTCGRKGEALPRVGSAIAALAEVESIESILSILCNCGTYLAIVALQSLIRSCPPNMSPCLH